VLHLAKSVAAITGERRLAMAGGVALNCVANGRILREAPFDELHVVPNAGDRGLALGAALYGYHVILHGKERHPPRHDYLGRPLSDSDIIADLRGLPDIEFQRCARLLSEGNVLGWVQGGAEFGPRALGHRSILADPRTIFSKHRLDGEIKRREWFRPYAPSVLAEHACEYFDMRGPSPYMLQAVPVRGPIRERIPGVVHVDGSARVQTVERGVEPRFYRLISAFDKLTGIPIVINTSFNGYGEPMVESAADAVRALHLMGLDGLAIGDYFVHKKGARRLRTGEGNRGMESGSGPTAYTG
jgi:carbamoyltransferase